MLELADFFGEKNEYFKTPKGREAAEAMAEVAVRQFNTILSRGDKVKRENITAFTPAPVIDRYSKKNNDSDSSDNDDTTQADVITTTTTNE
jgi:hypothetical protein